MIIYAMFGTNWIARACLLDKLHMQNKHFLTFEKTCIKFSQFTTNINSYFLN